MRSKCLLLPSLLLACGSRPPALPPDPSCDAAGFTAASRFPAGSADGHADPMGARAAKQARAGRVRDSAMIVQPADAKQKIRPGDFLLINEKIAVYVESAAPSDSYQPFGGDILAISPVGSDGRPLPTSQYSESAIALARQTIDPDSVTVLNDGSDGKAAIVRSTGRLRNIPFMDVFEVLAPDEFNFPAALDFILEPGAEKVTIRLNLMNTFPGESRIASNTFVGFFHVMRNQTFTDGAGYGTPASKNRWVGYDSGDQAFAWRMKLSDLTYVTEQSGFQLFTVKGLTVDACTSRSVDYAELVVGAPGIDGLRSALRRVDGDATWREITGVVRETGGAPVAGALVHAQRMGTAGSYVTRASTDGSGAFVLHAPPEPVTLTATRPGYAPSTPVAHAVTDGDATVELVPHGTLVVNAIDEVSQKPLPVRVQVIPVVAIPALPASFGVEGERNGRLHQEFAVTGSATLAVPPGSHRVIISRGYEWELFDRTVVVESGKTTTINATLLHSVDSTGVLCADFHIHSNFSADSSDPVEYKVKGAIADGLEIPVSSEHEWVVDFAPVVQKLGLTAWAYGMPSEEFTTFAWGHFGVVPIYPRPDAINNGAVEWIGKKPPEVFANIAKLPENPVLIINHPSNIGFGGYFSAAKFNRATATGDATDIWSDQFEAVEVFNDEDLESSRNNAFADWTALLDSGRTAWAVGSSDSHSLRGSPAGYPRTCLRFGHDDPTKLTPEKVRDVLRSGAAVVSGGLYMTVEGPGMSGPGATLTGQTGPLTFKVTVQSPSWIEATTLETFVDGKSVKTELLQEAMGTSRPRRYEALVDVTPTEVRARHHVIFHASSPGKDLSPVHPGRHPFAVSNPIFF